MADPYNYAHQQARLALTPTVNSGNAICAEVLCLMPSRRIIPGTPWDLAHNRHKPGTYLGPAHARCNRSEGARFRNTLKAKATILRRWTL